MAEYAKADPEDLLIRITVENHGPETAVLHLLPTIWFPGNYLIIEADGERYCFVDKEAAGI